MNNVKNELKEEFKEDIIILNNGDSKSDNEITEIESKVNTTYPDSMYYPPPITGAVDISSIKNLKRLLGK